MTIFSWRKALVTAAFLSSAITVLHNVATWYGFVLWSLRPIPSVVLFQLVVFLFGLAFSYALQKRAWLLGLVSGVLLLASAGVSFFVVDLFSPVRQMTEEELKPLALSEQSGQQLITHPTLGFSVLLTGAPYQQTFKHVSDSKGTQEYQFTFFVTQEDDTQKSLRLSLMGADLNPDELERYAEGLVGDATITERKNNWSDSPKEVTFWLTKDGTHQKLRVMQLSLGPNKQDYVVALSGSAETEEAAEQLVERFWVVSK